MLSVTDEVAKMFSVSAEELDEGPPRFVTFRIPENVVVWVDTMASHADVSRSAMLQKLVRVGVSEVLAALPDVIRGEITDSVTESFTATEES